MHLKLDLEGSQTLERGRGGGGEFFKFDYEICIYTTLDNNLSLQGNILFQWTRLQKKNLLFSGQYEILLFKCMRQGWTCLPTGQNQDSSFYNKYFGCSVGNENNFKSFKMLKLGCLPQKRCFRIKLGSRRDPTAHGLILSTFQRSVSDTLLQHPLIIPNHLGLILLSSVYYFRANFSLIIVYLSLVHTF